MKKILLVEDDPNLNFTILTALEAQGYAVDAASTTGEAIERLSENAYQIVLTDIYIDERTGLDVLDAARRKDPRCAVILMTGRGTVETVMAATRCCWEIYIDERTGLDVLDAARRKDPRCAVILMTGRGTVETVMAATRGGAFEYIAKIGRAHV